MMTSKNLFPSKTTFLAQPELIMNSVMSDRMTIYSIANLI
jgi:hypothetical protein